MTTPMKCPECGHATHLECPDCGTRFEFPGALLEARIAGLTDEQLLRLAGQLAWCDEDEPQEFPKARAAILGALLGGGER